MSWFERAPALALIGLLAACGFHPLYGRPASDADVAPQLAQIFIEPIADRIGQVLHNQLRDRLTPRGVPREARYRLNVALDFARSPVALQKDQSVTRVNLTVRANYVLSDAQSGSTVSSGTTRSVAAFNVVRSDFATLSAERDAERRAVRDLGDEISTRLAVSFASSRTGG